jgi:dipeptidyl aminopeptidase/acylaminoacyl peptidase
VPADFDRDCAALEARLRERRASSLSARTTENRIYRFWDRWLTDDMVNRLFAVDVEDGTVRELMPGSAIMRATQGNPSYDIAPNGREVAVSMNSTPPPYASTNNDVFLLRADGSGEMVNITSDNPANDLSPQYSRDGRYVFYGRQARPDFYADTVRLVRYDRNTRTHRVLTADVDRSFTDFVVGEDGSTVYARAEADGATAVFAIPAIGGNARVVHRGGTVTHLALAPGNQLLFTRASFTMPPEVYTVSRGGGRITALTSINETVRERIAFGRVENVWYEGADGARVQAWIVYPPDFDPARKWPLINMIHGGPHGITGDDFHFRWNMQVLAAPGYVVIGPNFHGSTSFGQEFAISIHGSHADKPYRDVMKATDFMVARGYIDESRMAAAGGSYGGYLVSWIAGRTDRFAALVNHAGVYNLISQFASDSTLHREAAYGGTPWADLDTLNAANPAKFAHEFTTPMLVIHGELDYRVPVGQGLELYGVLQGKGVPSRFVYYPDENHWILKPQNSLFWYETSRQWLEKYVRPGPGDASAVSSAPSESTQNKVSQ